MQLVYAAEERDRDFQIADGRAGVPDGARVYATCTGAGAVVEVGEVTFQTMTDAEYYELRAQVREARERAAAASTAAAGSNAARGFLRRLVGR